MKKFVFRFDIDTHKCIKDGVPNLLDISEKYRIPFSFFLNTGKSVSFYDSLKTLLFQKSESVDEIKMMGALKKLGIRDYLIAAIINPSIISYEDEVKRLLSSNCEVGLHGGRNHAKWQLYVQKWDNQKVEHEIQNALKRIYQLNANVQIRGFASPAWNSPECLMEILKKLNFEYCADLHGIEINPIEKNKLLPTIGVNLLGEPGGVAFWESCRVNGMSNNEIVEKVVETIDHNEVTVIYDHPYYVGTKELDSLVEVIEIVREKCEIVSLYDLIK